MDQRQQSCPIAVQHTIRQPEDLMGALREPDPVGDEVAIVHSLAATVDQQLVALLAGCERPVRGIAVCQLTHQQEREAGYQHGNRQPGGNDGALLRNEGGQRVGFADRHGDDDRKAVETAISDKLGQAIERAVHLDQSLRSFALRAHHRGILHVLSDACRLVAGSSAYHAIKAEHGGRPMRAEIDRPVESIEIGRIERHIDDAAEAAVRQRDAACHLDARPARDAPGHRSADIHLVFTRLRVGREMLAVADIVSIPRAGARPDDAAIGSGHIGADGHFESAGRLGHCRHEVERSRVVRIECAHAQQHLVDRSQGPQHVLFEGPGQVERRIFGFRDVAGAHGTEMEPDAGP
ncbi:MAG: hypothetical protein WDO24_21530 [Pseudomonadota bacterium]